MQIVYKTNVTSQCRDKFCFALVRRDRNMFGEFRRVENYQGIFFLELRLHPERTYRIGMDGVVSTRSFMTSR